MANVVDPVHCWQKLDSGFCDIANDFMGAIMRPLDYWFFNSFGIMFWGAVCFIVWRQSGNSLYAGLMGVLIATGLMVVNNEIVGVGLILLVLSATVAVYHMFVNRTVRLE